jgi:hypothetical protein
MKTETPDQTTIPEPSANGAPAKRPNVLEPLKFVAKRDVELVGIALELRREELKNLAKKNAGEGYHRESNVMLDDAMAIELRILPQLRSQRELPLVSYDDLEKQITAIVAGPARRVVAGLDEPKASLTKTSLNGRSDRLTKELAPKITAFARDVAKAAFAAGLAARTITPEGIASEQLRSLGGRDD